MSLSKLQKVRTKNNNKLVFCRTFLLFILVSMILGGCLSSNDTYKDVYSFFDPRIDFNTITDKEIDIILSNGADINEVEDSVSVFMHVSCLTNNPNVLESLGNKGANLAYKGTYGNNALLIASSDNTNPIICKQLVKMGFNINEVNNSNRTPIVRAIELNPNPEVINELIRLGANINSDDTMLHIRVDENLDVKKLNLSLNTTSPWLTTPYHLLASFRTEIDIIDKVFNRNNINALDKDGYSILMCAARNNTNPDVLKLVIKKGANQNYLFEDQFSILMVACAQTKVPDNISILIENGHKVNYTAKSKESALHLAMYNENPYQITSILIKNGAKINVKDQTGQTPLMNCSENADLQTLKLLIDYGANVNEKSDEKDKPSVLFLASSGCKNPNVIRTLIKSGANKRYLSSGGVNLLSWALQYDASYSIIKTLLQENININQKNRSGQTPLMFAAKNVTNPKVIQLLLSHGADASMKDNENRSMLDYVDIIPNTKLRNSLEFELLRKPSPKWICWMRKVYHLIF